VIELRQAESDAELEAWRRVRSTVVPNERAPSVDELRRLETPDRLLLLAELDGELAGSGFASRSDMGGLGSLAPRVLPEARRRGVGAALLEALATHLAAQGFSEANALVDDDGSLAFAARFGFREVDRQIEQVRTIGREEAPPQVPAGAELAALADRPDLSTALYTDLAAEAIADIPVDRPLDVSLEDWEREWTSLPEGTFLALAGGEIVGCAGLMRDDDRPDRAEHSLTAVRRDWRGRGIAKALKQATIAWAAESGIRELYTWTQRGNEPMQRLNERLGYVVRSRCWTVRGPVPLR
jgi:GNAT superfamily N-acetyltransferase